jgi:hypothetical protein
MGDDDGGGQREAVVTPREKPPGGWYYSETAGGGPEMRSCLRGASASTRGGGPDERWSFLRSICRRVGGLVRWRTGGGPVRIERLGMDRR